MFDSKRFRRAFLLLLGVSICVASGSYFFKNSTTEKPALTQNKTELQTETPSVLEKENPPKPPRALAKTTSSVPKNAKIKPMNVAAKRNISSAEPSAPAVVLPPAALPQAEPAAQASPTPSPVDVAVAPAATTKSTQYGQLTLSTGFEYSAVNSKDRSLGGTTLFLSDLSPKLSLSWNYQWTPKWGSYTQLSLLSEKITDDTATNPLEIKNQQALRKEFGLGVTRQWSVDNATSFGLGVKEQLFSHASVATTITMDRIPTGYLRLAHDLTLLRIEHASIFAAMSLDALAEAKDSLHKTQAGTAAEITLGFRHDFTKFNVETKAYYGVSNQNSNLVEQNERHLGAAIGLTWRLDP